MRTEYTAADRVTGFIRLLRWPNLLIIGVLQFLVDRTSCTNDPVAITLLILMTLCATAAGYLLNDVVDIPADRINAPYRALVTGQVSVSSARYGYLLLSLAGLFCAIVLTVMDHGQMLWVFGGITLSLWMYTRWLQGLPVLGNLMVSFLCGFAVCLPCILRSGWEILPIDVVILAVFAFLLTWIREIVKDLEDMEGDEAAGYRTLPVAAGAGAAVMLSLILIIVSALALCMPFLRPGGGELLKWLLWLCTAGSLVFCGISLLRAETPHDFHRISGILKICMVTGASLVFL